MQEGILASRRRAKDSAAAWAVWSRPRAVSSLGWKDWMPRETRVTPSSRKELGLGEVKGGGVGFEVDFFEGGEVEDFAETGEEVGEVFFGEEGGGSAA